MNRERYNPYNRRERPEPNCDRCLAPMSTHFDGKRWTGCPYRPDEHPCGYNGCSCVDIEDEELWLCREHRATKSLARPQEHRR